MACQKSRGLKVANHRKRDGDHKRQVLSMRLAGSVGCVPTLFINDGL